MAKPKHPADQNPWRCVACRREIDWQSGISIDESLEPQVCRECWGKLSVPEQLEQVRQWRLARQQHETMKAFEDVCRGALDGFHLRGMGEAGRN